MGLKKNISSTNSTEAQLKDELEDVRKKYQNLHGIVMMAMKILPCAAILVVGFFLVDGKKWHGRPSVFQKPEFARYMISNAEWGIVAAYSLKYGQPFGTLQSFADGPVGGSSGIPYFYISQWSTTWHNIMSNNTVSLTVSEAESDYCEARELDPEEPVCGRVMLTGEILTVDDQDELAFAQKTMFTRHPAMKNWPKTHKWTFMKLRITSVNVLSFYGGISHVPLLDYYKAQPK